MQLACTVDLVCPSHSLQPQELLDPSTAAKPAEAALLGAAMGQIRFVVDCHVVDVDGTMFKSAGTPFDLQVAR